MMHTLAVIAVSVLLAFACLAEGAVNGNQTADTCPDVCPVPTEVQHWTVRNLEGRDEVAGLGGAEFLGLGYDIIFGNPRGSLTTEIDPGFRSRIVPFNQNTYFQRAISCIFSSRATKLSTMSDLQDAYSEEVKTEVGINIPGIPIKPFLTLGGSVKFSRSEKVEEFMQTTSTSSTEAYESTATCTKFQIGYNSFIPVTPDELFLKAVQDLPETFDGTTRQVFENFLQNYGTHYVSDVVLGGKHFYTSFIKASDVQELSRQNIDVSRELSLTAQATITPIKKGGSLVTAAAESSGNIARSIAQNVGRAASAVVPSRTEDIADAAASAAVAASLLARRAGVKVNNFFSSPGDTTGVGITLDGSFSTASSQSSLSETQTMVANRVERTTETNIGGRPPADPTKWATWAETLTFSQLMPVTYSIRGLDEFMSEPQQEAYVEAVRVLYGLDFNTSSANNTYVDKMRFGIAQEDGSSVTPYSDGADSRYRTSVNREFLDLSGGSAAGVLEISTDPDAATDFDDEPNQAQARLFNRRFLSGMRVFFDTRSGFDDEEGILGLDATFRDIDDWSQSETANIRPFTRRQFSSLSGECPQDQYVYGARVCRGRTSLSSFIGGPTGDRLGIAGIDLYCATKDGSRESIPTPVRIRPYGDNSAVTCTDEEIKVEKREMAYVSSVQIQFGPHRLGNINQFSDSIGMTGLQFILRTPGAQDLSLPALNQFQVIWEGIQPVPLPSFALPISGSIVPNAVEEGRGIMVDDFRAYPFGLIRNRQPNRASIAIANFRDDEPLRPLLPFTYLVVENPSPTMAYQSGAVTSDGIVLSKQFSMKQRFEIEQDEAGDFVLFLDDGGDDTSVLIAPLWIENNSNSFPRNLYQVAVAVKTCAAAGGRYRCSLAIGDADEISPKELGFSFFALSPSVQGPELGIVHGKVSPLQPNVQLAGIGWTATPEDMFSTDTGVRITFNRPFQGIPSVYVTPIIGESTGSTCVTDSISEGDMSYPYVVLESVTEDSIFVKVIYFQGDCREAIPFYFVAVSPPTPPE